MQPESLIAVQAVHSVSHPKFAGFPVRHQIPRYCHRGTVRSGQYLKDCHEITLPLPRPPCGARTDLLRAVFALMRTRFVWDPKGVHTSVNAARNSACATSKWL